MEERDIQIGQLIEDAGTKGHNGQPEKNTREDRKKTSLLKDIQEGKAQAEAAAPAFSKKDKMKQIQTAL